MFNIGGGELLVIALIALIVLGPQRLPEAARQAGKMMGDLRRLSTGFQSELTGAFSENDANPAPRGGRDALGAPAADDGAVSAAAASVSGQTPRRTVPLQAAPAPGKKVATKTPSPGSKKATKQSAKKASPAPKGPRPRAKG